MKLACKAKVKISNFYIHQLLLLSSNCVFNTIKPVFPESQKERRKKTTANSALSSCAIDFGMPYEPYFAFYELMKHASTFLMGLCSPNLW